MTLTLQQMFDTVLINLTAQGVASTGRTNPESATSCQYRGEEGRKCAAGWLIADEHYTRSIEGENSLMESPLEALVKSGVPNTDDAKQLVSEMQNVHDTYMPGCDESKQTIKGFHEEMQGVARQFGLTFTTPTGEKT